MKKFIGTIIIAMLVMTPFLLAMPISVIAQPTMKLSDAVGGGTGGTFYLSPSILYYDGVTISGDTWIYGNGAMIDLYDEDIDISGAYLYIERCTIANGEYALDFDDGASGFVYNNIIVNSEYAGIYIYECSNIIIKENSIIQGLDEGIYFGDSTDITILENTISINDEEGIYGDNEDLYDDDPNSLHNILIKGNKIAGNYDYNIYLEYVNGVSIASNWIYGGYEAYGIELDYCPIVSITYNKILANEYYGIYYSGDSSWPIIDVDGTDVEVLLSLTISYNKIIGNYDYGVEIYYAKNVVITYNEISMNDSYGIYIYGMYDDDIWTEPILIAYNTISYNYGEGIYMSDYVSNVSILFNKIVGNDEDGIYIYADNDGDYGDNLLIKGNIINGNLDYAMYIEYWNSATIEWNTILGNYEDVYLYELYYLQFLHNTIMYEYGEEYGLDVYDCDGARFAYNIISYNTYCNAYLYDTDDAVFEYNTLIGAYEYNLYIYDCWDIIVRGNIITDSYYYGIYFEDSSGLIISNIIGYSGSLSGNEYGIYLSSSLSTEPEPEGLTTISDNTIIGNHEGIHCSDSDPTIVRNYIANNVDGIYLSGNSDATIGGTPDNRNYIIRNYEDGIHIADDNSDPTINYNNIYWNVEYGVYSVSQTHTDPYHDKEHGYIDAENNWWGSMDGPGGVGPVTPDGVGPGHGDEVSDYIDYIPWLTAIIP